MAYLLSIELSKNSDIFLSIYIYLSRLKIFVGLDENSLMEVLDTNLKNDSTQETFHVKHTLNKVCSIIYLSKYIPFYLYIYLSIYINPTFLSIDIIYIYIFLSIYLHVYLYIYISHFISITLSLD